VRVNLGRLSGVHVCSAARAGSVSDGTTGASLKPLGAPLLFRAYLPTLKQPWMAGSGTLLEETGAGARRELLRVLDAPAACGQTSSVSSSTEGRR